MMNAYKQGLRLNFSKLSNKCVGKVQSMKQPMVIMHGFFGNSNNNRTLANCVLGMETHTNPDMYRDIYLLDMRNHGISPGDKTMTYEAMAQDIFKFTTEHGLSKPVLVGHSMGGKVAMECVLERPELASAMVCIENAPVKQPINTKFIGYIDMLQSICANGSIKTFNQAKEELNRIEANPLVVGFLSTVLKKTSSQEPGQPGLQSKLPLDILRDALRNGSISDWKDKHPLPHYRGPSLFIKGSKSDYLQASDLAALKQWFPTATLKAISGAGHFVNAERPRDCAHVITKFLSAQTPQL